MCTNLTARVASLRLASRERDTSVPNALLLLSPEDDRLWVARGTQDSDIGSRGPPCKRASAYTAWLEQSYHVRDLTTCIYRYTYVLYTSFSGYRCFFLYRALTSFTLFTYRFFNSIYSISITTIQTVNQPVTNGYRFNWYRVLKLSFLEVFTVVFSEIDKNIFNRFITVYNWHWLRLYPVYICYK